MAKKKHRKSAKEKPSKTETGLSHINTLFSAYGTFLTGLFCIFQHLFAGNIGFNAISLIAALIILLITFWLSYGKGGRSRVSLWRYFSTCADHVGFLNPIMLAVSIILSVTTGDIARPFFWICVFIELVQLLFFCHAFIQIHPRLRN